jgi:glycosyl transferase family 25
MDPYLLLIVILLVFIYTNKDSQENYTNIINSKSELNTDDFDIYLINMDKNTDRLIKFTNNYNKTDLILKKFKRFSAIVGKDLNLINFTSPVGYKQILETEKTGYRTHHYDLTRGAVGCYLSHLSIYKKILDNNLKYGIIFEDDCKIVDDFYSRLQDGLSKIPQDWDIYLLGVICLKCDIGKDYIKITRFWGLHSYMINKRGASKLIEYLDKPLSKQIDADISLLIKRGILNVYAINPIIAIQDNSLGSDIQSNVKDSDQVFNEEFKNQELIKLYAKN